jgi:hypothetical protein
VRFGGKAPHHATLLVYLVGVLKRPVLASIMILGALARSQEPLFDRVITSNYE